MTDNVLQTANTRNVFKFLEKTYDETFSLLVFARDYFTAKSALDKSKLSPHDSCVYSLAMSVITTQLTSCLAWLLLCRAVQNGEVGVDVLKNEQYKMPEFDVEINETNSGFSSLNPIVREMLSRSSRIYKRVKRISRS